MLFNLDRWLMRYELFRGLNLVDFCVPTGTSKTPVSRRILEDLISYDAKLKYVQIRAGRAVAKTNLQIFR